MTEATTTSSSPSASLPDFYLPEFGEDYHPLLDEGRDRSPIDLTNADFSLDVRAEADVENQFQFTPESFTPSVPKESQPDTGAHDQTSLMRLESPSYVGFDYPNKDADYQGGVISNYDFNESFSIPPNCPDTCTANFQVTQLLEVAKQKEHAAQLLLEAAKCREYTVHSLLVTQGGWGMHNSIHPFGTLPSASTYAYDLNQDLWGLQDAIVQNSAPSMATPLSAI
jgi:hypothetical protein